MQKGKTQNCIQTCSGFVSFFYGQKKIKNIFAFKSWTKSQKYVCLIKKNALIVF